MFKKKRKDGYLVEMEPVFKIIPLVMEERSDAQVWMGQDIPTAPLDKYIREKKKEGINIGYMHILYAATIRTLLVRPKLNQFIMKGRLYRRNSITISMMVKKDMTIDGEETAIKVDFTGHETPAEIKEILNKEIFKEKAQQDEDNEMDALVKLLTKMPQGLLRWVAKFVKFLDRNNMMPNSIIKASPFHTSAFITNIGSLGIDAIFHHIYNFGTVGIFLSLGKIKRRYILNKEGKPEEEKTIGISFVADERICDGYYFASALKQLFRYLKRPELLDLPVDEEAIHE